jgi:hypothetical protein
MTYTSLQPAKKSDINTHSSNCIRCRERYFTSTSESQSPAGSGEMFQLSTPGIGSGFSSDFRLFCRSSPSSMFMGVVASSLSAPVAVGLGSAGSGRDVGRTIGLL